jgi:hypothetical protein
MAEELLASPDAVITFTINRFLSATQGQVMLTSLSNPDVTTDLTVNTTGRVTRKSNNEFELSGGNPHGNPLTLHLVVLPKADYAAVDLVIRKVTPVAEGGTAWDQLTIGNGANDNVISVRDHGRVPDPAQPITYEFYMFIRRRDAGSDYPFGDIGVIDPLWTNH